MQTQSRRDSGFRGRRATVRIPERSREIQEEYKRERELNKEGGRGGKEAGAVKNRLSGD